MMESKNIQPVVLISGASSGIGAAIAKALVKFDYRVFGTARNPNKIAGVAGVQILPLDVRSPASVDECVETVLKRADRVDVLVNNAGSAFIGAVEECSDAEIEAQFEVNFYGVVRLTRAVLPGMRERKHGHIINISSVAARVAVPFQGVYAATKAAIEGYSEALFHEVLPYGIHVSVIEPGFIRTGLGDHSQRAAVPIAAYDPWREAAAKSIKVMLSAAPEPDLVARSVLKALRSKQPRFRYPSANSGFVLWAHRWLPERLFYRGFRSRFNLAI